MQSSSILELYKHLEEHPEVIEIERRQLKTITLNTLYENNNIPYDRYDFINLDIQGAELKALKGMEEYLNNVDYIYTEVNSDYVYKGCALIGELDQYLIQFGLHRVETKWTDYKWGDAFYIRK